MSSRLDPNRVFSGMATEHTLKEVVKAVSEINLNVGDIIVGDISVQSDDTTTHSKLDTLNTTVINKTLNKNTSSIDVSGQTLNVNVISDSLVVEPVLYNLQIVGEDMYGDSINGAIVDPYGREGWFWTNSATTGGSNAYWYSNTIVPQNQMTKAQMDCVYIILALDRVKPNIVLPIITMYSLPTGSGDISLGFAHSRWTYVIPATNILNAGEVIMLTIGDHTKVDKIRPELRRVHLELFGTNGDALPTEVIGLISLNTDSGTKLLNSIQYLLQNAGFYYSVTNKVVEYEFNNGVQNAINVNLTEGGIKISNTVTIGGNVNVDNFPISQAVTGTFWQATQPVSGSVSVSNLPATQPVSGSVSVSNLPAVQTVDGSVGISNFPNTQTVNGTVNIGNLPTTQPVSGSVSVSNFPASQAVTGTFFQATQPVSGTFFQATQPVSGSVSVSNLPATQPVSGSVNVDNFPAVQAVSGTFFQATQPVSGSVSVSNLPTTQAVSGTVGISNFPASQAVTGAFFQSIQPVSGSVSVSNLPTTQAVSGTVGISNFPASQAVTGAFFQSIQPVSGDINVLNLPTTQNVNGSVSISNFPATQAVSGSVTVNTISGFALESGGNLASIKTNTDKIKSDTTNTDAIQVQVKNSSIPVSGNVTVNTISGFALDTTTQSTNTKLDTIHTDLDGLTYDASSNLNVNVVAGSITVSSVNIKDSSGNNIYADASGNLKTNIQNSSIDTHCYASSDGTNWHHLKSTNTGNLITESKTHDGSNVPITSTLIGGSKQSLDVNVANTVPVTGTFFQATQPVSIASSVPVTGTFFQATQPVSIASSVPVTGTFFQATQPVSIASNVGIKDSSGNNLTSTSNNLDTNMKAFNRTGATTSNLTTVQPVGASSSVKALETYSYMVGLNNTSTLPLQITSTTGDTTQSLDVEIQNGSTTNFNSGTGLNVYQILPKVKMYTIGGFDETSSTYRLFGLATPNGINTTATNFGLANPRVHYGGTSSGTDRVAYIDYVNSSGDLVENAGPYTFNSVTYATLPNMIAPIKFRLTSNLSTGQAVYISITANSSVTAVAGQDQNQYCIGTFTVPNGYIGYISNLTSNVVATTNIQIVKWDVNGIRSVIYRFNNTGNADHTAGYEGGLGGIFYAGETVAFSNQTAVAGKSCFANMILKSLL
jgi:hypothetical protein